MPSLRELMQISMESFDSQPTCEVASSNEHYIHFRDTDGTSNQPLGSRSKMLPTLSLVSIIYNNSSNWPIYKRFFLVLLG